MSTVVAAAAVVAVGTAAPADMTDAAVVAGRGPMTSAPASPVMTPRSLRGDDFGAIAAEPLRLRVRHSRVAPAEAGGAESVARRLIESWFSCEPGLDA